MLLVHHPAPEGVLTENLEIRPTHTTPERSFRTLVQNTNTIRCHKYDYLAVENLTRQNKRVHPQELLHILTCNP